MLLNTRIVLSTYYSDIVSESFLICLGQAKSSKYYNVICEDGRECCRKTERNLEMGYGEIKASIVTGPKSRNNV